MTYNIGQVADLFHLPVSTLRYYDNMKYSEISHVLNTSEGALKASYHIAAKKISEYLLHND